MRLSAAAAAEKVKRTGTPFRFNPMNSRERRVIHIALRNETELRSESAGAGPFRHVVDLSRRACHPCPMCRPRRSVPYERGPVPAAVAEPLARRDGAAASLAVAT